MQRTHVDRSSPGSSGCVISIVLRPPTADAQTARRRSRRPGRRSVPASRRASAPPRSSSRRPTARSPIATRRRSAGSPRRYGSRASASGWCMSIHGKPPTRFAARAAVRAAAARAPRSTQHDLVRRLGVTVTPEVAHCRPHGAVALPRPHRRSLRRAWRRSSAWRRDTTFAGRAGSRRVVAGQAPVAVARPDAAARRLPCIAPTLKPRCTLHRRDVAPIVFDKCASCHRPGGPAPFSLLTYADVRQRASPDCRRHRAPLHAAVEGDPDPAGFVGQKRLSDDELAALRRVGRTTARRKAIARSCPSPPAIRRGMAARHARSRRHVARAVRPRRRADRRVSHLRRSRCRSARTKYVTGLEFQPGNPRVVHHANIRLDPTAGSRDARRPRSGAGL